MQLDVGWRGVVTSANMLLQARWLGILLCTERAGEFALRISIQEHDRLRGRFDRSLVTALRACPFNDTGGWSEKT